MSETHPQIERARALAPLIAGDAEEINRIRKLTPAIVTGLKSGGFFRMLQPKSIGGMELPPLIFTQITEALASMDGSVGWVVCQSNGCSMSAAYLDPAVAREMFGPVDGILAWGPPGPFEAQPVEGGYCLSGTWRFASGSQNATWLGAHARIAGTGELRSFLFPKAQAKMTDIWHTLGLRGTASNQYSIADLFIPEERAMHRDDPAYRQENGLLYRFTSGQLYSIGFAGVGLGIARGLIDAFLALPGNKVARGASRPMRDNNVVQSQLAQSEARWRSARAFLHNTLGDVWRHVEQHGEMTEHHRAMIRLAATWAIQQSREAVNTLFHASGSVAVFEESPFERRLRDMHTVAQQAQGRQLHFETVGQIMLGLTPENLY
ncbi:MAG TPA: acyl-CoA dehydrogenase family protein [Acetobacteraceae bacterium]|nr:acyl-CoA dehydrogenase family protein [Acetobacteraceae bacterium]